MRLSYKRDIGSQSVKERTERLGSEILQRTSRQRLGTSEGGFVRSGTSNGVEKANNQDCHEERPYRKRDRGRGPEVQIASWGASKENRKV